MLCCIGDLVEDVVVWLPSDIAVGTDTTVTIHRRRGGSASNVAVAAASLGVPVRFIGRVGDDPIGAALVDTLRTAGVDPRVQVGGRTGTIVVLVDTAGERSMLPDRGAATDLDAVADQDLAGVSWLHAPAYSLVGGRLAEATREAIGTVRRRGGTISLDVSSVSLIDEVGSDEFSRLIETLHPDVVFCNRDEADRLGVGSAAGIAGVGVTVVKAGPDPAVTYAGDGDPVTVPARAVREVRDTTGAGDAFAAGFIVARMRGADLVDAVRSGHVRAAELLEQHAS